MLIPVTFKLNCHGAKNLLVRETMEFLKVSEAYEYIGHFFKKAVNIPLIPVHLGALNCKLSRFFHGNLSLLRRGIQWKAFTDESVYFIDRAFGLVIKILSKFVPIHPLTPFCNSNPGSG